MNVKRDVKASIKLVKMSLFLFMYLHFAACIWYMIIDYEKTWIPPYDYKSGFDIQGEFYEAETHQKYLASIYYQLIIVFGTDVGPRSDFQLIWTTFMSLMGAVIQATMFGELAVLVFEINKDTIILHKKIDQVNTYMKKLGLKDDLQEEVLKYIKKNQYTYSLQEELVKFQKLIPCSFNRRIMLNMISR